MKTFILSATELPYGVLNHPSKNNREERIVGKHPRLAEPYEFKTMKSKKFFNTEGCEICLVWEGDLNLGLPFEAFEQMEKVIVNYQQEVDQLEKEKLHEIRELNAIYNQVNSWRKLPWYVRIWKALCGKNLSLGE